MSGVNLRVRTGTVADLSLIKSGEIVISSDGVIRVNTASNAVNSALEIPSLIGYLGTQGITGAKGRIGSTGVNGSTGYKGDSGFRGIRGTQGSTGDTGSTGAQGYTGAKGYSGAQGNTGPYAATLTYTGSQGTQGLRGSQGATGFQGLTGINGLNNHTGQKGFTGAQGFTGTQGYIGSQGLTGPMGLQGGIIDGDTGSKGSTGSQGAQGLTGIMSFTGSQGQIGFTGAQGLQGSTGAQGSTGINGLTASTGAQGVQGTTGAEGAQGFTGIKGSTGWTGAQGFTGTQGLQGFTGPQGRTGFTGAQGAQGSTGAQGQSAVKGYTGPQGQTGFTGAQGFQGTTGTQTFQGSTGIFVRGPTGSQGLQGATGPQGQTGSQALQGATGAQGYTGFEFAPPPIGAQGITGATGAQGYTGITSIVQGSTGAQGFTGAQGLTGPTLNPKGFTGVQGTTGTQGISIGYTAALLTNQSSTLVGYTGGIFTNNSNVVVTSKLLTVPNLVTCNLTAATVFYQPSTVTPITFTNSSNGGSNTLFMIGGSSSSYPVTLATPVLLTAFQSNIFTQVLYHPSGWLYLYSDSNLTYSTASNYIYSLNLSSQGLSNMGFSSPIYHMALDPLGNIFISSCNITRYTVNTLTGVLSSNVSVASPFPGARVYATLGYVYAYLTGATSNVYRYTNSLVNRAAFVSIYPGTLSFFSANARDTILYSTTTTSNIYSYNVSSGVNIQLGSNLDSFTYTPVPDSYANSLYSALPRSNSIAITGTNGTSTTPIRLQQYVHRPISVVYNPVSSNIYVLNGNLIQSITPSGTVSVFAGSSNAGNVDGSNAQFNSPKAICIDATGYSLYIADTGNSSIRRISLFVSSIPTFFPGLQLWLDGADPFGNGTLPANYDTISSWIDKSGNAYNTSNINTGTAVGKTISYTYGFANGLGGIVLTNYAAPAAPIPSGTFTNAITVYAVFKALPTMVANAPLLQRMSSNSGLGNRPHPSGIEYTNFNYDYGSPPTNNTQSILSFNPSLATSPMLLTTVYRQTGTPSVYLYSNGNLIGSNTSLSPAPSGQDTGNVFLPAGRADGNGSLWDSVFGEILVYNTNHTSLERQQIEGYLAYKWGISYPTSNVLIPTFNISTFASGLSNPQGVICDSNNLYVSDTGNHVIKKYNIQTSAMTIIAGSNGVPGSVDNVGSNVTATRLNSPRGLAVSLNYSSIYIADYSNYTIRQYVIASSNIITYIGTPGMQGNTATTLFTPTAVGVSPVGQLFICDTGTNAIRYVGNSSYTSCNANNFTLSKSISCVLFNSYTSCNLLYGCEQTVGTVFSYNISSAVSSRIMNLTNIGTVSNSVPTCIAFDSVSNVYAGTKVNGVFKYNYLTTVPSLPNNITGLQLWLDATDPYGNGLIASDGVAIASWIDKSGNGYSTSNINAGNAAGKSNYYMASFQNDLGGIVLSNFAYPAARIPTGTFADAITIFAVYKALPTMSANCPLLYRCASSGANLNTRAHPISIEYGGTNGGVQYDYQPTPANTGKLVSYNPSLATSPIVLSAVYTQTGSPSFYLYSNGILIGSNIAISPAPSAVDLGNIFCIAGRGDGNSAGPPDSIFGEVLVYNTALDNTQRQRVEAYLLAKWKIGSNYSITPFLSNGTPISGTGSTLSHITGIAVDAPGSNVYLTMYCSHYLNYLLKVNTSNKAITVLASNIGNNVASNFYYLTGLVLDSSASNLYFCMPYYSVILNYNFTRSNASILTGIYSNTITPFTGVDGPFASATFYLPQSLLLATNRIMYVQSQSLSQSNGSFRVMNLNTSNVTTGFSNMFNYANTFAVNPSESVVYCCSAITASPMAVYSNMISETTILSNTAGYVDGSLTSAQFNFAPGLEHGMCFNPVNNNLYIWDYTNYRLRMINFSSGTVSTIAGNGTATDSDGTGTGAGFANISSMVINSSGTTLYAIESTGTSSNLRVVNLSNLAVSTITLPFITCRGICIDPTNTYLYFTRTAEPPKSITYGIQKYTISTGSNSSFITLNSFITSIAINSTGTTLYYCDSGGGYIKSIDIATSNVSILVGNGGRTFNGDGYGTSVQLTFASTLAVSTDNSALYFIDYNQSAGLRKVELVSGLFAVTTLSGTFSAGTGTGINPNPSTYGGRRENLAVSPYNQNIYWINSSFQAIACISLNSSNTSINPIIRGGGALQVIATYAGSTSGLTNANGSNAQFNSPLGISFKDSSIIIADSSNALRIVDQNANVNMYIVEGSNSLNSLQNLSVTSNSLYTMANVNLGSTAYPALLNIPFAAYPSTTYTFSNIGSNTQIQNTTGRPITISVVGQTVTNPVLPSLVNESYVATLYNTGTSYSLI